MLRPFITVIYISLLSVGCQTAPPVDSLAVVEPVEDVVEQPIESVPEPQPVVAPLGPPEDLWERIRRELTWQDYEHSRVDEARERFLAQPDYLPVISQRASLYLYYIVEEVERRGMPMEIALLPMVESTMNPFAYSSERAAGLWQIIPATAEHYGLERNWWYDGRKDVRASTDFALNYLERLHAEFEDDWMLALAAYNSGKGRVGRARKSAAQKGLATDYWSLSLPRETRYYVPKLIALAQIFGEPDSYGVEIPTVSNSPAFEVGYTGGQIELLRAAELADVELSTLRDLNPGQLRWASAPDQAPELLLPLGTEGQFSLGVASLTEEDRVRWQHYRIQRGDSLIRIAKKFDTDVGLLREANGIRGSMIRAGDTLMIPYGSAWSQSLAMLDKQPSQATGYRVRQGDSLYRIAGKFNVTIDQIISWNSLDPSAYLQPGQRLTLYVRGS